MGKGQSKRNSKEERLIELLFDRLDNSEALRDLLISVFIY